MFLTSSMLFFLKVMAQKLFCPVYICGVSGAGKTTLANRIVGQIKKDYPQGNVPRIQVRHKLVVASGVSGPRM